MNSSLLAENNTPAASVFPEREEFVMPVWLGVLLSLLGGGLMFGAFPPVDVSLLVWVGLIPLLTALWSGKKRPEPEAFLCSALYGWVFGLVYYGGSFFWITEVSSLGYVPLTMYLALYPALWGAVMGSVLRPSFEGSPAYDHSFKDRLQGWKDWSHRDMVKTFAAVLGGASLWVCIEWLRGWVFTGFGWNGLGVALYDKLALVQVAEYVGVTALAFIPAMANIWLWCVGRRLAKMMIDVGKRSIPWDFFILCSLLMLLFIAGSFLMNHQLRLNRDAESLPLVAIQLNQSQEQKWSRANVRKNYHLLAQSTLDALLSVEEEAIQKAIDTGLSEFSFPAWVVWPESSLPERTFLSAATGDLPNDIYQFNEQFFSREGLMHSVREETASDFVLLTGGDEALVDENLKVEKSYNVLYALTGGLETRATARKIHLVPFGEYIPFREYFPFLEKAFEASAGFSMGDNFTAGDSFAPLEVPFRPGSDRMIEVIPSICFEDTVGRLLRRFSREAPQVIVNVTNDGWFNQSWANEQHWRNAAFRCIELRRPMIRAANTGVTVAIAPSGAVIDELRAKDGSPFTKGYLYARLPLGNKGLTLYAMLGDWAVLCCALAVAALIARRAAKNRDGFLRAAEVFRRG